jgi:hypothetical protein
MTLVVGVVSEFPTTCWQAIGSPKKEMEHQGDLFLGTGDVHLCFFVLEISLLVWWQTGWQIIVQVQFSVARGGPTRAT